MSELPAEAVDPGFARRRRLLYSGVAAAAGLAGAGLAWWRWSAQPESAGATAAFWVTRFTSPEGAALPMSAFRGRPLLVNFWATWCPPCVDELPMVDAFYRQKKANGMQVLGIAVDKVDAVQAFLRRTPVSFPIAMAGLPGADLSRSLGNAAGGLPYTVVFGSDGVLRHRKIGQLSPADLSRWADVA
ncbi:MAG: TlpA disulfide reductase family protein [Sulfurimicrobium sp.]|nr:TlpA disulfide reductase family protein [Burkholderiaceae bacterium]MDO8890352.1 TlpA disulfide reductase family protein [Sulfurimicrobium sp.]